MRDRFHYNDWGVRTICKVMKKSLFSPANKANGKLATLNRLSDQEPVKVTQPVETEDQAANPVEVILPTETSQSLESPESPETVESVEHQVATDANQSKHTTPENNYDSALLAQLC